MSSGEGARHRRADFEHSCCNWQVMTLPLRPLSAAAVCPLRRQYCEDEPDWAAAVELLGQDGGAGWQLLGDLAGSRRSAGELAGSRFCQL